MPVKAATSAGVSPKSSFRKKLTASRAKPKMPWTKYTSRIAVSSKEAS